MFVGVCACVVGYGGVGWVTAGVGCCGVGSGVVGSGGVGWGRVV